MCADSAITLVLAQALLAEIFFATLKSEWVIVCSKWPLIVSVVMLAVGLVRVFPSLLPPLP